MRLSLYYPVRPFSINQKFGANLPCVRDFGLTTQEVVTGANNFTCPIGYEKLYPKFGMRGHNGTDFLAGVQKVFSSARGTVIEKQTVPARGFGLGILTDEPVELDEYGLYYVKLRYWHLKSFNVDVGDRVNVGTLIGVTDNTGYSSGNHLHFEGQPFIKDVGGHPILTYVPGNIAGAINMEPFFNGIFAEGAVVPPLVVFSFFFAKDLQIEDSGGDVVALQKALTIDGVFPASQPPTGYFGNITLNAVKLFQAKYGITPGVGFVGPLTRARLNAIYG